MEPSILFRCDISPQLGSGHLRRCLALANEGQRAGIRSFWRIGATGVDKISTWLGSNAQVEWCQIDQQPECDLEQTVALMEKKKANALIIDHYKLAEKMDAVNLWPWLRFDAGISTVPTNARWIHNALPGADRSLYTGRLMHDNADLLLGPSFALLRPEFTQMASIRTFKETVNRIVLTFGGGDDRGAFKRTLHAMHGIFPRLECAVICSSISPNLTYLKQLASENAFITLHVDTEDVAAILATADLAVCAGGTTLNEMACMGVPALVLTIAENQEKAAELWAATGACKYLGCLEDVTSTEVVHAIGNLMESPETRLSMAEKGKNLVDGQGTRRTLEHLIHGIF